MRRIAVLAGLTALLLSLPAGAPAAATPDWFTLPTGFQVSNFGVAVDGTGDVWFGTAGPNHTPSGGSSASQPTPSLARLDPSAAHPGTSDGITTYPTPDPPAQSCCANQLRSLTYNTFDGRVYYVRSDGGFGTFTPSAAQPGTVTGMSSGGLPYPVDLWDVAPSKAGGVWFTESSTTNVAPYWGDRIAYYNGSVSEGPNIAMQNGQTSLNSLRYDANPEGIAVDGAGRPWFAEADAGNPGYRIGTYAGTGDNYLEYLISPCEASSPCSGSYTGEGITDVAVAQDGKVWFTNYLNRKFGFFDPQTQSFTQYTTAAIDPYLNGGSPRTISAAPDGTLWITNFRSFGSGNALIRVVPGGDANHPPTATYTALGQNEAPLGLTASSGDVWFTAGNGKLGRLAGVIGDGVAPPGGGGTDPGAGTGGTGTTSGGTGSAGGTTPAPAATTPASARPPAVLRPASIGTARADPPQTGNGAINTNQICVGPPEARCSLVYLVQTHEYVTGFPARVSKAKRKPRHRPQVLATKALVLHGGQSKKVTIKLNPLGRRILRKLGRIKVDFVTSERQADGTTKVVSTKVVTIKAAKARKKRR